MDDRKTLAPRTRFDEYPREDVRFCYICNKLSRLYREEGDKARNAVQDAPKAYDIFAMPEHFDAESHLCDEKDCFRDYSRLPRQTYREVQVMYSTEIMFDNQPFVGFPRRKGWPGFDCRNLQSTLENLASGLTGPISFLEPLYQAWLFFGFLHEAFGGQFDSSYFVESREDTGQHLSLRAVIDATTYWMYTVERAGEAGYAVYSRVNELLSFILNMLTVAKYFGIDENLQVLIASTAEVVGRALTSLFPSKDVLAGFSLFYYTQPEERLVSLGWCRSEAFFSELRSPTIAKRALYSQIDRRNPQVSHESCTRNECRHAVATSPQQTNFGHRPDCPRTQCYPFILEQSEREKLNLMLQNGTFPLLELTVDVQETITARTVAYDGSQKYVAISHVWAQGLGNDEANSLSVCHLLQLHAQVQILWRIMYEGEPGKFLLWLDTFCCPVRTEPGDQHRRLAILRMRDTYAKATAVLAIDTEWQSISHLAFSPLEIAARVFISAWFHRLWTLQEGTLPLQLWFQFQNGPVNAHSLHLALRDIHRDLDMRDRLSAVEMLAMFQSLRILSGVYLGENREQEMDMLTLGMAHRKVLRPLDEAICVTTLVDLDILRITAEHDLTERTKVLWLELHRKNLIPRNMIFFSGDRLSTPGFRWAYSTFMQEFVVNGFSSVPDLKGTVSDHGLLIQGEGIVFKMSTPTEGYDAADFKEEASEVIRRLPIKSQFGDWHNFMPTDIGFPPPINTPATNDHIPKWKDFCQSGVDYALIRKHVPSCAASIDDKQYLLVKIKARRDGMLLCRRLNVGNFDAAPFEPYMFTVSSGRYATTVEQLQKNQKWCID